MQIGQKSIKVSGAETYALGAHRSEQNLEVVYEGKLSHYLRRRLYNKLWGIRSQIPLNPILFSRWCKYSPGAKSHIRFLCSESDQGKSYADRPGCKTGHFPCIMENNDAKCSDWNQVLLLIFRRKVPECLRWTILSCICNLQGIQRI